MSDNYPLDDSDLMALKERITDLKTSNFIANRSLPIIARSRLKKFWLFSGSLTLFIIISHFQFQPLKVWIIVFVLLLHESGHILAMKAFGYRDTTMLFIPWLGALAIGNKGQERTSLSQNVGIYLAGPLPGLILGIVLAIAFPVDSSWIAETSKMLIFINFINLLPIYPLDGGQTVNLLIFSRYPYVGIAFQVICGLASAFIGFFEPIMFVISLFVLVSAYHNYRLTKLQFDLKIELQDLPTDSVEELAKAVFWHLSGNKYRNISYKTKALLIESLLVRRRQYQNKWFARLGLSIIYLISLIGSLAGILSALVPNMDVAWEFPDLLVRHTLISMHSFNRSRQKQIALASRQLQRNPKDASAYVQRAQAYSELDLFSLSFYDINRAIALNPKIFQDDSLQKQIYVVRVHFQTLRMYSRSMRGSVFSWQTTVPDLDLKVATSTAREEDRFIQEQPNDFSGYLRRAERKRRLKDRVGAIADYTMALKLQPHSIIALLGRAASKMESDRHQEALLDIDRALALEPRNIDAYSLRMALYEQIGDVKRAAKDRSRTELLTQFYVFDLLH